LLAGFALPATPAQAGFLPSFSGASDFGTDDGQGGSSCALCDSTVNFSVYEREDANWLDDAAFDGFDRTTLSGTTVGTENYVYLYQVINTDPLNVSNPGLENFNVTHTDAAGNPIPGFLAYGSGGFFANAVFQNAASNVGLDAPNDGVPTSVFATNPLVADANAIEPNSLSLTASQLIASAAVKNGAAAYTGALFGFVDPLITADGTSSVMFLTSDLAPSYVWAESESPGGFGAAGDVAGVVPEPSAAMLLLAGVGGLWMRRRRSA